MNLTVSSAVDTFMQATDQAGMQLALALAPTSSPTFDSCTLSGFTLTLSGHTTGDIWYDGGGGVLARLPLPTDAGNRFFLSYSIPNGDTLPNWRALTDGSILISCYSLSSYTSALLDTAGDGSSFGGALSIAGTLTTTGYPTSDPHVVGEHWNNLSIDTISAG